MSLLIQWTSLHIQWMGHIWDVTCLLIHSLIQRLYSFIHSFSEHVTCDVTCPHIYSLIQSMRLLIEYTQWMSLLIESTHSFTHSVKLLLHSRIQWTRNMWRHVSTLHSLIQRTRHMWRLIHCSETHSHSLNDSFSEWVYPLSRLIHGMSDPKSVKCDSHVTLQSHGNAFFFLWTHYLWRIRISFTQRVIQWVDTWDVTCDVTRHVWLSEWADWAGESAWRVTHVTALHFQTYVGCLRLVGNYRSLLQNIVSFIGLFCKRDL